MNTQAMITRYADAGYPAIAIASADEDRAIASIANALPNHTAFRIACAGGLIDVRTKTAVDPAATYTGAFARIAKGGDSVLIVLDYQHIIRNATAYRSLRDALLLMKASGSIVVLVAPAWKLPAELEHDVPVIQDSLPSREELANALEVCKTAVGLQTIQPEIQARILDGASGLTLAEAEGAMALSLTADGTFDPDIVTGEKMKLVRQSGKLEVSSPVELDQLGGLVELKRYITEEVVSCIHDAQLRVRGVMLVGIPGGGKSLSARVFGSILGYPVLRADVGKLKGSLQGDSEANMYAMLRLAEAVSPCILYLDEIEKGVGGHAGSAQTDGGVTLGMIGILLTWLADHQFPIITIATCNDFDKLPAELTRAGRFDEKFFVDLPTSQERLEIAAVHLRKFGANGDCAQRAAEITEGWTGAEIEQLVKSAARRTRKAITPDSLTASASDIKPISIVKAADIARLRDWGTKNLRMANTPEPAAPVGTRKIKAVSTR